MMREAIERLVSGGDLTREMARDAFREIASGKATPAMVSGFLVALRMKGETVEEITGFVEALREAAIPVPTGRRDEAIDMCGTGGDGANTFNISTAASFVVAGAGVPVAKHGNRAASSRCGGADVLEALGVDLDMAPDVVGRAIDTIGIGFLFARKLHPAMGHAAGPRRELGIRTIFNLLGPLTNPAGVRRQLLGVFAADAAYRQAEVLRNLGTQVAWVVHSEDGLDEISPCAPTGVVALDHGEIREFIVSPKDAGVVACPLQEIQGGDVSRNVEILTGVLDGKPGPARDAVLLNAGAALVVAGRTPHFKEGVELAARSIDSGQARSKLDALVRFGKG